MKKVLIITYYWPPSGGAGVQRWVKFAKYLPDFGIEPIILTVDPAFASYPIRDESLKDDISESLTVYHTKSKEPFGLYKKLTNKKEIPHAGFANESAPSFMQKISRAIRGNFFIPDARKGWNAYALEKALELIKTHGIETVVTSSPPHSTQLIGLKIKQKTGIHWVADLRDPWTDIYYYKQLYHSKWAKAIDKKYELQVIHAADNIVVVSEDLKRIFTEKLTSSTKDNVKVIPNGFDEDDFNRTLQGDDKRFIITYTGTLAANYHIDTFLESFSTLISSVKRDSVLLRFVGVVASEYKHLIEKLNLGDVVEYVDHVPHKESIKYMQESTLLLLAIPDVSDNKGILTGKLFEYLAAQKTIIGIGPEDGDAAKIIDKCKAGKMFAYNNKEEISQFINQLYNKWISKKEVNLSTNLYRDYSRRELTTKLANLLKSC